ncbi:MAG: hypothetical protein ACE14L_00855 [Terriglobales bacterium]
MALLDIVQYGLWFAAPLGQLAAAVAMVCRRLHREFPWFFVYTVFHIIQAVAGLLIYQRAYTGYFYFYWGSESVDALLSLAVIQEVFSLVFREYGALERLGQILYRWAVIVLIAIAVASAASAPGTANSPLITGLLVLERSTDFVNCGLLFFLFLLSRYFGLLWRHVVFGIAFGMGVMTSILTITAALQAQFATSELVSRLIPPIAFDTAVAIWVWYCLAPEPKLTVNRVLPGHEELQKWNDALADMVNR